MKTSRFSDSQIIAILKQAEAGSPVPELCREHGISNATFYKWRSKFGGMDASLMARMKELEDENRRLKKMYAEERLRLKLLRRPSQKNGSAISTAGDGAVGRCRAVSHNWFGVRGIRHQPDLLPVSGEAKRGELRHCRLAGAADE
jgi:putative transposase